MLHERIERQRSDDLHKQSKRLVEAYDLIAIENLTLAFMNRNRHLALSSHDAGFGILRRMLEYKDGSAGIPVIAVKPANTSHVQQAPTYWFERRVGSYERASLLRRCS